MGGTRASQYLADELRNIADQVHTQQYVAVVKKVVDQAVAAARKAAKNGNYSVRIYDDNLGTPAVDKQVKQGLQNQGFKVVIAEDHEYSDHANQPMFYVEISWK